MALDVSAIVGIILMSVGTLMVVWGLVLCYTTKVSGRWQSKYGLYQDIFLVLPVSPPSLIFTSYQIDISSRYFSHLYLTQGEYYNADEVQAMVAAEMLEEKRKKKEEEAMFDDIGEIGKKKRKGPLIAE